MDYPVTGESRPPDLPSGTQMFHDMLNDCVAMADAVVAKHCDSLNPNRKHLPKVGVLRMLDDADLDEHEKEDDWRFGEVERRLRNVERGDAVEFNAKEKSEAEKTPKERRETMPESAFLEPPDGFPVKVKRDGRWVYDKDLLEKAEQRASQYGHDDIRRRARSILEREFG